MFFGAAWWIHCRNPTQMNAQQLHVGQKVHYMPAVGEPENGIVKAVGERVAWVVYRCDGQWDRHQEFTGASTRLEDLREGWV